MKKTILLVVAVVAFTMSVQTANAQFTQAVLEADRDIYHRKATGTSDDDYPSIEYVQEGKNIPTIGELKKIIRDYTVSLGYKAPEQIMVKDFWWSYKNRRTWVYRVREVSTHYPGEDAVSTYKMTQKRQPNGVWKTSDKKIGKSQFIPSNSTYSLASN